MHPSTWAGVIAKLLEHPELIGWMIFLLVIITVAILLTMKAFVNQTPGKATRHHQARRSAAAATKVVAEPP
jgi:hypothetical protein